MSGVTGFSALIHPKRFAHRPGAVLDGRPDCTKYQCQDCRGFHFKLAQGCPCGCNTWLCDACVEQRRAEAAS